MTQTSEDLAKIERRLTTLWSPRNQLIEEMRRLRFMQFSVEVPAAIEAVPYYSSRGYQIPERMVPTLTANPITLSVPPAANTDAARRASSLMERWTMAALAQLAKQSNEDVMERFVECLVADGHGCMRLQYSRAQHWGGYPRRKKSESADEYDKRSEDWKRAKPMPLHWQWVDPLCVYPLFGETGPVAMLEVDHRDIAVLHPERWSETKKDPELIDLALHRSGTGRVKFSQLWTRDRLVYAIDGQVVHDVRHSYGRPPYVYFYGIATSLRDPELCGLSSLFPLRHSLIRFSELITQKSSTVRLDAWPTWTLETPENSPFGPEGSGEPFELVPGTVHELTPGQVLRNVTNPGPGPDADELLALVGGEVDRAGISELMRGGTRGEMSGYAINQLIAAARTKFKPIIDHTEMAMELLCQLLWDIVEYQVKETLYVYSHAKKEGGWLALGPDDLNGYRQVKVSLNPIMPSDEYAKSSMNINLTKARLKSRYTGMSDIGIEQPEEEEDRILLEMFRDSPQVQAILVKEVADRYGLKLQKTRELAIAELAQLMPSLPPGLQQAIMMVMQGQQGGGGPGQPGMPGGPRPGMRPGVTGSETMAAPGVQAVPQPGPGPQMVGRQVRPSGIGTGREPGVRR